MEELSSLICAIAFIVLVAVATIAAFIAGEQRIDTNTTMEFYGLTRSEAKEFNRLRKLEEQDRHRPDSLAHLNQLRRTYGDQESE